MRDLIDFAVAKAPKTKWKPLFFGSLKSFASGLPCDKLHGDKEF